MLGGYDPKRFPLDLTLFLVVFACVSALGALQCVLASQAGPITRSELPLDSFSSLAETPNEVSDKAADKAAQPFKSERAPSEVKPIKIAPHRAGAGSPVQPHTVAQPAFWYGRRSCQGVSIHVVMADPRQASGCVSVQCARGMPRDAESFSSLVNAASPRAAVAGTYFSKTTLSPVGDIVVNGRQVHFGGFGTALTASPSGDLEFKRVPWARHVDWSGCKTVLAAGPTLLREGAVEVDPVGEGYRDPHVLGSASRCAIGDRRDGYLVVACVPSSVSLTRLAAIMRELGCWNAMALDGGGSLCLYVDGEYVIRPGRELTNILTIGSRRAGGTVD